MFCQGLYEGAGIFIALWADFYAFCLVHWRILQSGGPPPVLHVQSISASFWRNCQNGGNPPSFPAHIDRNRQSLLCVKFAGVCLLVVGCGYAGRIVHNIDRSKLHSEAYFGLP
jgi:hypothetical protein